MAGKWLYDDAMYRFDTVEPSYWEATASGERPHAPALENSETCDVAVIGGGYTGLSAAYHLASDGQLDVRLLEAGPIGWGASGRNGGFCSLGGEALGAQALVSRYGTEAARDYYRSQVAAVELVRQLILENGINAEMQGDSEVIIACSPRAFDSLKQDAEFQFRVLGLDTSIVRREEFARQYFDTPMQHGAAIQRPTFGLHPLRYVFGLADAARRKGAGIHANSEVIDWTKDRDTHVLVTAGGSLRARNVILATNGFMPEHLHRNLRGRSLPMISAIVVTRPLTDSEIAAHAWQTDSPSITALNLLNYYRVLPDGRFMFGGRGSADGSRASSERNFDRLIARMHEVFPEWEQVDIEYRWHGLICMNRRLTPALGRFEDDQSVLFGFGFHGNGVNTATWTGKQLASWLTSAGSDGGRKPDGLSEVVLGMPGGFPLPGLRLKYIQAGIAWRRFLDSRS